MPSITLGRYELPLPAVMREWQGCQASLIPTTSDGACSIHSVWGGMVHGELFKPEARSFLREAFGADAHQFKTRVASPELVAEIERGVWEMLAPMAKQTVLWARTTAWNRPEATLLWSSLLQKSGEVADRCCEAWRTDMWSFPRYRAAKEDMNAKFCILCTGGYGIYFVRLFLESVGMLDKYMIEQSEAFEAARNLTKFELLLANSDAAVAMRETLLREVCLDYTFEILVTKIDDITNSLLSEGVLDVEPVISFACSVCNARDHANEIPRVPFAGLLEQVYPAYLEAMASNTQYCLSDVELLALARCGRQNVAIFQYDVAHDELMYVRSYFADVGRPPICTCFSRDRGPGPNRTHFQRLHIWQPAHGHVPQTQAGNAETEGARQPRMEGQSEWPPVRSVGERKQQSRRISHDVSECNHAKSSRRRCSTSCVVVSIIFIAVL